MTFAPGNVVTLKSGGQSMTVVSVGDEAIDCVWFSYDGELFRQSIPAVALMVVDDPAESEEQDAEEEAEKDEENDDEDEADEDEDDEEDGDEDDDEGQGKKRSAKKR